MTVEEVISELQAEVEELNRAYHAGNWFPTAMDRALTRKYMIEFAIGKLKKVETIEHNQKMTEEEAWQLIAEKHVLKSAAQASNVFTQGKLSVWPERYKVNVLALYKVVLFENQEDRLLLMQLNEHEISADWESNNDGYRSQWFTEKQIKEIDVRYWAMAERVTELEYAYKDTSF